MANTTITDLPNATTPLGPEYIVLDQAGATKKLLLSDLFQTSGSETITSLSLFSGVLTYIDEAGVTSNLDILNNVLIDSDQIVDGAVKTTEIYNGAVTTAKIDDGAVISSKIANGAVTTAKILDANVTTAKILDANVTTAKILDANVTTAKIADANVTTSKIADANVTFAKLTDVIDDDTMATATNTNLATSESIKAYIDSITYIPNIVQAVKSDFSGFQNTTAMTFVDIPGLQVSITPKSANSKMLVESSISASTNQLGTALFRLVRDGTNIGLGDVDGTATRSSFGSSDGSSYGPCTTAGSFLDSPTSIVGTPIVYKVQCTANNISVFINRGSSGNSTITFARSISTLTVTEIPQ